MSDVTQKKLLTKIDKLNCKIGYPEKVSDYSSPDIRRDDYLGNVRREQAFVINRKSIRIGKPVDRTEWPVGMMPSSFGACADRQLNGIVVPAGTLQPPFFDQSMDDAVNYGAVGTVIGHEMTHNYDDQGRHYDADGNLSEWWTDKDAKEFEARAQKLVDEYASFEALPGLNVNGKLTLSENIADLGGVSIAYHAMERALAKDPSKQWLPRA